MPRPASDYYTGTRFGNYSSWANHFRAYEARLLARLTYGIANILPGSAQERVKAFAQILEHFASMIVEPRFANMQKRRNIAPTGLLAIILDGGVLGFWLSYVTTTFGFPGPIAFLFALIAIFVFVHLPLFLLVSGDIYYEKQDEGQQAMANEAATQTLYLLLAMLLLFVFTDRYGTLWHGPLNYQFLALTLVVIARVFYMVRLAFLRWHELATIEVEAEDAETR